MATVPGSVMLIDEKRFASDLMQGAANAENWALSVVTSFREAIEATLTDVVVVATELPLSDNQVLELRSYRCENSEVPIVLAAPLAIADELTAKYPGLVTDVLSLPAGALAARAILNCAHNRRLTPVSDRPHARPLVFNGIVAKSGAMADILTLVGRVAPFQTTVLIQGESGTGKELVARAIHSDSPRRLKPFVAINCGAIPESLIESELFGHRKGSFTDAVRDKRGLFEEADGGTLFLDEVAELPLLLQVKLLRALQEKQILPVGAEKPVPIDVRLIAATLRDLEARVSAGLFRDDLFYRLNVVAIQLPPLRERAEEIPALVQHFIRKHNKRLGLAIRGIDDQALECLTQHYWKGNIRELENCIERAMVLTDLDVIDLQILPEHILASSGKKVARRSSYGGEENLSIKVRTRELEIALIEGALERTKGNRTRAAKILEISHRALLYKLKEYGIQ